MCIVCALILSYKMVHEPYWAEKDDQAATRHFEGERGKNACQYFFFVFTWS